MSECPIHKVPYVAYEGEEWCKFCGNDRRRIIDILHGWLNICHWGLVLIVPLWLFASIANVPVTADVFVSGVGTADQPHEFWSKLIPIVSALSMWLAVIVGHLILRIFGRGKARVSSWFNATSALRDMSVVALLVSICYTILFYLSTQVKLLSIDATTPVQWWCYRAPFVMLACLIAFWLLIKQRWVSLDALFPPGKSPSGYVILYGICDVVVYRGIQSISSRLAVWGVPSSAFAWASGLFIFFLMLYLVVIFILRVGNLRLKQEAKLPLPLSLAIVGPSNVGKTVFLTRAYSLLRGVVGKGFLSLDPSQESLDLIEPTRKILEDERKWPGGTVGVSTIPFKLTYGIKDLVTFNWMDLPGGAFTNPARYEAESAIFYEHLVNCDALAMLIDACDLKQSGDEVPFEHIYIDVARKLFQRLESVGKGARPVPLAIIVTKSCRVDKSVLKSARPKLERIAGFWQTLATQCGLKSPSVQIFYSSAVFTADAENNLPPEGKPLYSRNCMEAVIWLAAQTLRSNVSVLDSVSGFHGRSDLQKMVLHLETVSANKG